jgi:hypothetical protein
MLMRLAIYGLTFLLALTPLMVALVLGVLTPVVAIVAFGWMILVLTGLPGPS